MLEKSIKDSRLSGLLLAVLAFLLLGLVVLVGREVGDQEGLVLGLDLADLDSVLHLALDGRGYQSEDVELGLD